jgi:hypothetical protein
MEFGLSGCVPSWATSCAPCCVPGCVPSCAPSCASCCVHSCTPSCAPSCVSQRRSQFLLPVVPPATQRRIDSCGAGVFFQAVGGRFAVTIVCGHNTCDCCLAVCGAPPLRQTQLAATGLPVARSLGRNVKPKKADIGRNASQIQHLYL